MNFATFPETIIICLCALILSSILLTRHERDLLFLGILPRELMPVDVPVPLIFTVLSFSYCTHFLSCSSPLSIQFAVRKRSISISNALLISLAGKNSPPPWVLLST